MIHAYVELSGESAGLGRSEAVSAAEALGGKHGSGEPAFDGLVDLELPDAATLGRLAGRLALAHRCLVLLAPGPSYRERIAKAGAFGGSAAVRRVGRPSGPADSAILSAGRAYVEAGGRIDLAHPQRRFWLAADRSGADWLFEETGEVDRASATGRRMPKLPFQRPVSLPPRLARAAANLARVRPGDRVLDPFLGTGALLGEAGLLGARVYGIDRDATMVRGALQNLQHLGVTADAVLAGDAGAVEFEDSSTPFDALLTDPPYGRSSSTGGETADRLVARVVPRWAQRVRPGGRIVLIVPAGAPPLEGVGPIAVSVSVRVHRSLTREFRAYEVVR
jgi:tRNA (guanine10-N2)-dimethyltransferase